MEILIILIFLALVKIVLLGNTRIIVSQDSVLLVQLGSYASQGLLLQDQSILGQILDIKPLQVTTQQQEILNLQNALQELSMINQDRTLQKTVNLVETTPSPLLLLKVNVCNVVIALKLTETPHPVSVWVRTESSQKARTYVFVKKPSRISRTAKTCQKRMEQMTVLNRYSLTAMVMRLTTQMGLSVFQSLIHVMRFVERKREEESLLSVSVRH